ncbi:hypothetical protein ACWEO2_41700 [Nocardia sp. NPDC004278]
MLLSHPMFDAHYEHHPQHLWLVLAAATMAMGVLLFRAAHSRRAVRLILVSLMFQFPAGFWGCTR